MNEIAYSVTVTFQNPAMIEPWLRWLRQGHIAEVLAGGAVSAAIILLDEPAHVYEIHYCFPSREVFDLYLRDHAPRLRAEGLSLFPPENGVIYRRASGTILDTFVKD